MKIHLYHPVHFEKWDYRHLETGIGGSETCQIELAWRLAQRGHEVHSYAPLRDDTDPNWRGSTWHDLEDVDFSEDGLWILFRAPAYLDKFDKTPDQQIWLMCQDENYPGQWNEERADKIDIVMALCEVHAQYLAQHHPEIATKIREWSNGVRMEIVRGVEQENIKRDPKKLIYASSPDRGLFVLFDIFRRAYEFDEELSLHVFYGTNNIDVLAEQYPHMKNVFGENFRKRLEDGINHPGVTWHGRISQRELIRQWFSAGIWCYPTNFSETNCITSMEAQCCGAIPITNPYWALNQHVKHGVFITGSPATDPLIRARYMSQILAISSTDMEIARKVMMDESRCRCNWERWVDVLEAWMLDIQSIGFQCIFQRKWATGEILNVGCADDPAGFGEHAVNLDVRKSNPLTGISKADVLGDIRSLPQSLYKRFDTVVLGDILEHFDSDDSSIAIAQSQLALRNGGRIVLTVPDDPRQAEEQGPTQAMRPEYTNGVPAYHHRRITRLELEEQVEHNGFNVIHYEPLDYHHFQGHGIVAEVIK